MEDKKQEIEQLEELEVTEEKLITIEELRETNYRCNNIEIRKYLSLDTKQTIVDNILGSSISNEDGIKRVVYTIKKFAFEFFVVTGYTNINSNTEDVVVLYDELKEKGVIDYVFEHVPDNEIEFIKDIVENEINQILTVDNSIENILSNGINALISKIPTDKEIKSIIKSIPKMVNKIDKQNLKIITEGLGLNNIAMGQKKP